MSRCEDKPACWSFSRKKSLFWALFTRLEMLVAHVRSLVLFVPRNLTESTLSSSSPLMVIIIIIIIIHLI